MCELCRQLNENDSSRGHWYGDLTQWWRKGSHCRPRSEVNWAKPDANWWMQSLQDAANRMMGRDIV